VRHEDGQGGLYNLSISGEKAMAWASAQEPGPNAGKIIHTPAARAAKRRAITASGEMWKPAAAHDWNYARKPMPPSIHANGRSHHGNRDMWVTSGWNVRTNE